MTRIAAALSTLIAVLIAALLAALLVTLSITAPAGAAASPPLTVPTATLAHALRCSGSLPGSKVEPVLFIHGTTSNSDADFSWNWNREFDLQHWAYCDVDLPQSGNGDIQIAAQYVTYAIRHMYAVGHRRIGIVGHSQGGMIGRWSLKFWPDTRTMVADYVGLSASNHGTTIFNAQCQAIGCSAANWQQAQHSHFLDTLNAGTETYPSIDYTEIATQEDEIVVPYTSPYLPAGAHVVDTTVQAICPLEVVDHFGMSYDNAAWLVGIDALTHAGPAKLSRVSRTTCGTLLMPGVDPTQFPVNVAKALLQTATSTLQAPVLQSEPPLASYAHP